MHQSSLGTRPRPLLLLLGALVTTLVGVSLAAGPPSSAAASARTAARAPLSSYAGVPSGWSPARTYHRDLVVRRAGSVVHDVRVYGDIIVEAPNVTLRRVDVVGGRIDNNWSTACMNGLQIVRSTIRRAPGQATSDQDQPSVGTGGYVARRVAIRGTAEGFRVGGKSAGCGPVSIVDSYARIVAPDRCNDWHGDGLQGYDGPALTVRRSAIALVERDGCYGTAPFFYPSGQGNTSAHVDGLRVRGGGYPFRLGTPGSVEGLRIARGSWGYGPYDVACKRLSLWRATLVGGGRAPSAIGCRTDGGA